MWHGDGGIQPSGFVPYSSYKILPKASYLYLLQWHFLLHSLWLFQVDNFQQENYKKEKFPQNTWGTFMAHQCVMAHRVKMVELDHNALPDSSTLAITNYIFKEQNPSLFWGQSIRTDYLKISRSASLYFSSKKTVCSKNKLWAGIHYMGCKPISNESSCSTYYNHHWKCRAENIGYKSS